MPGIECLDHVAITVADVETTCRFYRALFGGEIAAEYAPDGKVLVRQLSFGRAALSVHQAHNGLALVARTPTRGAADLCFRWSGTIEAAASLLRDHQVEIVEGPTPRRTSDGRSAQSIYFRDPDGNLLELMAPDPKVRP